MKKTSIGTWAYNVGPYGENPIPFDTVGATLAKLNFNGMELGGFNGYPNPQNHPEKEQRDALKEKMNNWGLSFSGFAQDLWSEELLNTDDQTKYISEFPENNEKMINYKVNIPKEESIISKYFQFPYIKVFVVATDLTAILLLYYLFY